MDNIIGSSSLLDQVKKTLRVLGPSKFHEELTILNNSPSEITTITSHDIHKQIFLYLSDNSEYQLETKLKELQVKKPKITDCQFKFLLEIISAQFEISENSLLHHKTRKTPSHIVSCRMVLYYLLWNYYGMIHKDISNLIFHSTRIVHKHIVQFKQLNERIPSDKIILDHYKKILEIIKDNKNARS